MYVITNSITGSDVKRVATRSEAAAFLKANQKVGGLVAENETTGDQFTIDNGRIVKLAGGG